MSLTCGRSPPATRATTWSSAPRCWSTSPIHLAVLRELYRVLKPGGGLWLTAPFFFAEHMQPHDYYRYTRYGLAHLAAPGGL
jgi:SAM-dependent methyltransferase